MTLIKSLLLVSLLTATSAFAEPTEIFGLSKSNGYLTTDFFGFSSNDDYINSGMSSKDFDFSQIKDTEIRREMMMDLIFEGSGLHKNIVSLQIELLKVELPEIEDPEGLVEYTPIDFTTAKLVQTEIIPDTKAWEEEVIFSVDVKCNLLKAEKLDDVKVDCPNYIRIKATTDIGEEVDTVEFASDIDLTVRKTSVHFRNHNLEEHLIK